MSLHALVPHIYEDLEKLSDGKPLPITEEEVDRVVANMKTAIMEWCNPSERSKNFTVRMSNVGKPARQLWYEKRDPQGRGNIDGPTQIKFLYGHLLEEIVLMLVRMADYEVTDEQKEVKVDGVVGHMDCKINGEVVDVKTAINCYHVSDIKQNSRRVTQSSITTLWTDGHIRSRSAV